MHAGPLSAVVMQALDVLQRIRGTNNVQLEYEDIATASKVAAQVLASLMLCKGLCNLAGMFSNWQPDVQVCPGLNPLYCQER